MIEMKNVSKIYIRYKKREGIRGSIAGLVKREYEEKAAVQNMNLEVSKGEFLGLIGPNGAGKTTLIKLLTGIIAPTSGSLQVMGFTPNDLKNAFKQQYAVVMGQKSQLFFELTANDTLRLFQKIYDIPEKEYLENKAYFTELFGVQQLLDVQVRTLSLGERMKLELMAALLHNPRILFLDEPTIGLDAIASGQIRRFLKEINRDRGTTILLTSHYMEDIKTLCSRCVVVNHGSKLYDGNTGELFERYQRSKKLTVSFAHPVESGWIGAQGTLLEESPFKKVLLLPKEELHKVLADFMKLPGIAFYGIHKAIFYFILPYGMMATLPVQSLIGEMNRRLAFQGIGVVGVFTLVTFMLWTNGVRHYNSVQGA